MICLIRACTKCTFCEYRQPLLFRPRVFSRALGCGHEGGPRVHYGASVAPRRVPWRALWAFKVAASWLFLRDRFPPSQTQAGPWKPPNLSHFHFFTSLLLFLKHRSSYQRLGSYRTTAALQVFPFVTATNGASACVCVSVRVSSYNRTVGTRNTVRPSKRDSISAFLFFFFRISAACCCPCITR